jgi:ATP-binding cassette subfamily B protein
VISRIRAFEKQRGVPASQRLPAIALTALARPEDRMRSLEAGFQQHVAKPVELAELVVVIKSLVHQI